MAILTWLDLHQLQEMRRKKERLEYEREILRESALRVTQTISDMPHASSWMDPMAEYAAKLDDLDRQIMDLTISIEKQILLIESIIQILPANQANVIRCRYENGYSWRRVARELHYTKGHCKNLHTAALKKLGL